MEQQQKTAGFKARFQGYEELMGLFEQFLEAGLKHAHKQYPSLCEEWKDSANAANSRIRSDKIARVWARLSNAQAGVLSGLMRDALSEATPAGAEAPSSCMHIDRHQTYNDLYMDISTHSIADCIKQLKTALEKFKVKPDGRKWYEQHCKRHNECVLWAEAISSVKSFAKISAQHL